MTELRESRWKVQGAIPKRGQQKTVAEARAEHDAGTGEPS